MTQSCKLFVGLLITTLIMTPGFAKAEPTREFITSCTYGVLAGTLVGAATLAFTDKPGENLQNIARGASFGLYAGILLGAYVVYVIPNQGEEEEEEESENPEAQEEAPEEARYPIVYPIISQNGIEGAGVSLQLLSF